MRYCTDAAARRRYGVPLPMFLPGDPHGTAQLAGVVDSQWQIDKAVPVAAVVNGVQNVKNALIGKAK